ncbi:MAG: hypothetical protein ICV87_08700 [Gemmatimonadetes bacterium]|nr:hypothetical protein [Gemmatimonadota bacterium]
MSAFPVFIQSSWGLSRALCRAVTARTVLFDAREDFELGETVGVTFAGDDGTEITWGGEVHSVAELCPGRFRVSVTLRCAELSGFGTLLPWAASNRRVH